MDSEFKKYHPFVNFLYFFAVICFSVTVMHPLFLLINCISGFLYSAYLGGFKTVKRNFAVYLPICIFTAALNPLINHEGMTVLFYFSNGNPFTLESLLYGVSSAMMLLGTIMWFSCLNRIMTEDKIVYLFGKITPSLSLIVSMVFRFVPNFTKKLKSVINAKKGICIDKKRKSFIARIKDAIRIFSIMVTWSLENSVDTADSMKSRGYGLSGRTHFHNFKFEKRDFAVVIIILLFFFYIFAGCFSGSVYFKYFPKLKNGACGLYFISLSVIYLSLLLLPLIIEIKEVLIWKKLKSKI